MLSAREMPKVALLMPMSGATKADEEVVSVGVTAVDVELVPAGVDLAGISVDCC